MGLGEGEGVRVRVDGLGFGQGVTGGLGIDTPRPCTLYLPTLPGVGAGLKGEGLVLRLCVQVQQPLPAHRKPGL